MRRKFLATVLALALSVATMVGCGSSADSAADTGGDTGPAAYADETAEVVDEAPAEIAEPDDASQGLADVAGENDDFGRPPEEDLVPWDVEEGEETVTEEVPVTGEVEGIVVLQADWRTGVPIFTVNAINPDTGEYHNVSSFTFDIAAPINADDYTIAPFASFFPTEYLDANYASLFNSDYTCMVATKTFLGNEEQHAGWVDQSGNFFDVTEALGEGRQSDFDEIKKITALGFTPDNNFVYIDETHPDESEYRFAPLDNIVPGASYQVDAADRRIIMDRQSWGWLKNARPTNWVNEDQFLTVSHSDGEMVCALATVSSQSIVEIVPTGSLSSWSPVLGPDGSSVVFMAAPTSTLNI